MRRVEQSHVLSHAGAERLCVSSGHVTYEALPKLHMRAPPVYTFICFPLKTCGFTPLLLPCMRRCGLVTFTKLAVAIMLPVVQTCTSFGAPQVKHCHLDNSVPTEENPQTIKADGKTGRAIQSVSYAVDLLR